MSPTVCLIEGDGIGREVVPAAVAALAALAPDLTFVSASAGFETFRRCGDALPPATLEAARSADAVLLGAVGSPSTPTPGYRSPVVRLRKELDLFACVRPVQSLPGAPHVDLVVVRENTEGLYSGLEEADEERATTTRVVTRRASERIATFALDLARRQSRRRITVVHKANVLRATCGLFREAALGALAGAAPIEVEERLVDSAAHDLARWPPRFDVIVTTNLFGDVLSDLAAVHGGGLGLVASANLGPNHALFEPVHGSAPDLAGKGVCNPIATLRAAAMLLRHLDRDAEAARLEAGIDETLRMGPSTPDLGGSASTRDVAAAVLDAAGARGVATAV